ncbi:TonB-dependent receptor plug domain-containing protein [Bermanella sp. R86510]|uniref:TonB-dependent receptor plug domain-containing protein n=1 Tax=unclassified Bermanella TaxID=2627862 RepID=UPI0037C856EA
MKINLLRKAIIGTIGAATMLNVPFVAAEEEQVVEEVMVTGSRIMKSDFTSSSPISVVSSEQLEASGLVSVEDFLQNMPSVNGGDLGSSINNGNRGIATASLRGLGAGRTLILINGRRPATNDLNMVPLSYIERVDVLRDGASTTYGSDAIAGVINFITKKDFEGAQFVYQKDVTGEGDGEISKFSATMGGNFEDGNAVLSLEYTNREAIFQGDRDFSKCPASESGGQVFCSGSGTSYPAQFFPGTGGSVIEKDGIYRNFNAATDAYNYSTTSYMVTPQEVFSINANAFKDIVKDGFTTVRAFGEAGYSNRMSDQLMAPVGTFWGPVVGAAHPNNPAGEDVVVIRRLEETGGRNFTQDANAWRMVLGFEGELANGWFWDTSIQYGRFTDSRIVEGQVNRPRMDTMLDPAACGADAECLAATGDVGYWNPFDRDTLTQDMQDYVLVTHSPVIEQNTKQIQFNLSGDFGAFELPGGVPRWAAGYENRYEDYIETPDGAAALGQIYSVPAGAVNGDFTVNEFYGELNLPILAGLPGVERLDLELGVRSSDYDYIDDATTNSKIALVYAPNTEATIRTTFATGFRAPSINELFDPQALSAQQYSDPCVNADNPTVIANCQADGLDEDFTLTSNQAQSVVGGNPDLEPEESDSLTVGFVYMPEFLPGFSASLDYFNIKIEKGIGTVGTDNVITGCYESVNFSSPLCAFLTGPASVDESPSTTAPERRNAVQAVTGVQLANDNLSDFETSGFDFNLEYQTFVGMGDLTVALAGTYVTQYDYTPADGLPTVEAAGKVAEDQWIGNPAAFAELRTNLDVIYTYDNYSVNWNTTYQSETEDINASPSNLDNIADAMMYHNVQLGYTFNEYKFAFGIRNLLDEEPPYLTNNDDMNTIPVSYDTAGRYFYGRITAKF